ncbi:MAG: lysophospholipid acyltransferase family protein [Thermoleophilia bacterium]
MKKTEPYSRFIYGLSRVLITRPLRWFFHIEIIGSENLPDHGPAILASNHSSNMDPPLVCQAYPGYMCWMGKVEIMEAPVIGWYLKKVGAFSVRRGEADRGAIRRARELLDQGYVIAIFPEGTRQREGHLGQAQAGVGLLALTPGVPVIPIRLRGNEQIVRNRRLRRPKVTITIGAPLHLDLTGMSKGKASRQASDRIMAAIGAL